MKSNRVDHLLLKNFLEQIDSNERIIVILPKNSAEILYALTITNTVLLIVLLLVVVWNTKNGRRYITRRFRTNTGRNRRKYSSDPRKPRRRKFTTVTARIDGENIRSTRPKTVQVRVPRRNINVPQAAESSIIESWNTIWDSTSDECGREGEEFRSTNGHAIAYEHRENEHD